MKKLLIQIWIFLLFIAFCFAASAQITAVTATITDSDSLTWINAHWTVVFVPNASYPNTNQYTINGVNLTSNTYNTYLNQTGVTNSSGQLSVNLLDNTIIQPSGSTFRFTIQSNSSAPATIYNPIQIQGSSQSLTSYLSTNALAPRFPALPGAYGYGDIELNTVPYPGGQYFNTTSLFSRFWNGTSWANATGTVGVSSINGVAGAITFTGPGVSCSGSPLVCTFTGGGSSSIPATGGMLKTSGVAGTAIAATLGTDFINAAYLLGPGAIGTMTPNAGKFTTLVANNFNLLAITGLTSGGTFNLTDGKTFSVQNSITLAGTDNTTYQLQAPPSGSTVRVPQTLCNGTQSMTTGVINPGTDATTISIACANLNPSAGDVFSVVINGSPLSIPGYGPSTNGGLTVIPWETNGFININIRNDTANPITPSPALVINYSGTRP